MIAEKFKPLIGTGTVASTAQRRNVSERLFEQGGILETIPDPLFEFGRAAAPTLGLFRRGLWALVSGVGLAGLPSAAGLSASIEAGLPVRPRLILRS